MSMDLLVLLLIAAILGGAGWYLLRSRKKGKKCVGCPHSGSCGGCK